MATERVVAISMVKDEGDIVRETVGHMARQVDRVLVADNGSTDGTREILEGIEGVDVRIDPDPAYYQSQKMTALAMLALEHGADWIVPFDADEVHLPVGKGTIAERLAGLPPEVLISEAKLVDHVATPADAELPPVARMPWRRAACVPLRKVAVRARPDLTIHQGNHGATFADAPIAPMVADLIEVRHFPYRSVKQMIRKARNGAAAYAATDLPEEVGKHWRDYGRLSDEQLGEVFATYFFSQDPSGDGLVYAPALS